jgi:hypothetical protein
LFGGPKVFVLAAHQKCPKIFHGPSQITPAHPSSYFMTGSLSYYSGYTLLFDLHYFHSPVSRQPTKCLHCLD